MLRRFKRFVVLLLALSLPVQGVAAALSLAGGHHDAPPAIDTSTQLAGDGGCHHDPSAGHAPGDHFKACHHLAGAFPIPSAPVVCPLPDSDVYGSATPGALSSFVPEQPRRPPLA
ncbi:hypothetical protein [Pelomicrobium sp. G1]|jgi:hypothetical protein|uniref:hypothetical protein n=1 Tax=unclassified Pelomicrobium TaxID=2815318 RepID=UPI003497D24F